MADLHNFSSNVGRVVSQNAGSTQYSATRFSYAKNQRTVTFALAETWDPDGPDAGTEVDNYAVQWLREFRYDSGRDVTPAHGYSSGGRFP